MHYKFDGVVLKTENAAKPTSQASQAVLEWISTLPRNSAVLDYGCGKFRYTIPLAKRVKSVAAVDSIHQIKRVQIIHKHRSTLEQYAKDYLPNVQVFDESTQAWKKRTYNFIVCTNVLSAVPTQRQRVSILRQLRSLMRKDTCLFLCTQFRNSYFDNYSMNPDAKFVKEGWLVRKGGVGSFYAILPPERLKALCIIAELDVKTCYQIGESAYVTATV